MYKKAHRTVPTNTKYTDFVSKLNEDRLRNVNSPPPDNNINPNETTTESSIKSKYAIIPLPVATNVTNRTTNIQRTKPSEAEPVKVPEMVTLNLNPPTNVNLSTSTKFADLFSPEESNALQVYLLHKAASSPNIVSDFDLGDDEEYFNMSPTPKLTNILTSLSSQRRKSAGQVIEDPIDRGDTPRDNVANTDQQFGNKLRTSTESVANIVYSSIRPDYDENNPTNLPTGSDSKQDYDPHEPLHNADQLALRHELLNNIRAISRATYFEDLYTGKVSQNEEPPETEVLEILQNGANQQPATDESFGRGQRVESWLRESVSNLHDQDDEFQADESRSLFHEAVWQEQALPLVPLSIQDNAVRSPRIPLPVPTLKPSHIPPPNPYLNQGLPDQRQKLPRQVINYNALTVDEPREKRPYSFNTGDYQLSSQSMSIQPTASFTYADIAAKSIAKNTNRPVQIIKSNPTLPLNNASQSFSRHLASPSSLQNEQAQYISRSYQSLPRFRDNYEYKATTSSVGAINTVRKQNYNTSNAKGNIPRIYQRQNMNQWVAKKVWFYMNGNERYPRIEYRFRPKDLRDLDTLLNILNKKMPQLPAGARYLFTSDGRLINSVEELQNENSYVVSSIRKFKVR